MDSQVNCNKSSIKKQNKTALRRETKTEREVRFFNVFVTEIIIIIINEEDVSDNCYNTEEAPCDYASSLAMSLMSMASSVSPGID